MSEKPWWRDWRGVPPRQSQPVVLSQSRVWALRIFMVAWIAIAAVVAAVMQNGVPVLIITAVALFMQFLWMPSAVRRQVFFQDPASGQ